jgi:hypothetical protein
MKATPKKEGTTFYVKFFSCYSTEVRGKFNQNCTSEVDIPLRKLSERELEFLKVNTRRNWLVEPAQDKPGFVTRVTLTLISTAPDAPWNALRDYLSQNSGW